VTYNELCSVGGQGGEAVAEVGSGAVKSCAGEVAHLGDSIAECPADTALEDVKLGIAKEAELEGEVLPDEEASDDA
jgi:hypothetical protein